MKARISYGYIQRSLLIECLPLVAETRQCSTRLPGEPLGTKNEARRLAAYAGRRASSRRKHCSKHLASFALQSPGMPRLSVHPFVVLRVGKHQINFDASISVRELKVQRNVFSGANNKVE